MREPSRSLNDKLFYRELYGNRGISSTSGLYGSRRWVEDLDIIGELRGHDGCINALQWSRDGSLLASGSDDARVNIYKSNASFSLNTRIETGHTANIFSVKFMPHSSDRTIVTAAGDTQVRVFDIEYAPTTYSSLSEAPERRPSPTTTTQNPRRHRGARHHSHSQPTPGRIHNKAKRTYTSHNDRAKRIVTESSPYLFLTCSEDGTVRQFDLRQPSSFYVRPEGRVRSATHGRVTFPDVEDERNPPLISYRRHGIDLNTISCSTSQPHYIALGGSHLYCFLHDRRMLGRDKLEETGQTYTRIPLGDPDEESSAGATKCVRRFAPRMGKNWDKRMMNSHVTACKISDANPNEVVASWSGDGVYLFHINYSPHPNEPGIGRDPWDPEESMRCQRRAKRERVAQARARKRRRSRSPSVSGDVVAGQSMRKICSLVAEIRGEIFGYSSSSEPVDDADGPAERKKSYDAALALAHTALKRIHRSIDYLDRKDIEVLELLSMTRSHSALQSERARRSTLAKNRRRTRALVIAAGCVARAVGGFVEGIGIGVGAFGAVSNGLNEATSFRYRFLNAIIAFLNSGVDGVKEQAELRYLEEAELEDAELETSEQSSQPSEREKLDSYLRALERGAQLSPVRDVDTNENLFNSEITMVRAFGRALEIHSSEAATAGNTANKFWGERIARAVLMKEGEGIDYSFVEAAFAGEDDPEAPLEDISGLPLASDTLFAEEEDGNDGGDEDTDMPVLVDGDSEDEEDSEDDDEDDNDDDDDDDNDDDDDDDNDGDRDEDMGSEDEEDSGENDFWYRRRRNNRGPVEGHAPVWQHTKVYRGHCNVRTVKDVNFFGLNDEYVVSGSDCGHLFIWDRNTTELLQLLRGDEETVNVAVGHPYEPLLAVSGIDNTVKLFSPDMQLQREFGESRTGIDNNATERSYSGAASCRRLQDSHRIMGQNAVASETGVASAVITRGMLAQLVEGLRTGGDGEGGGLPMPIIEGGDCQVM
ncbi:WD40-repeat-containing domain protein [Trichophaea hybrida]|nr:WD40-repeat-containing domain protein [Trichophaea hybrida]